MLPLAVDYATPFIWAGSAVVVAGVVWVLSTAAKTGIGDIVDRKLQPLHDRMEKLEEMIQSASDAIDRLRRR